MGDSVYVFGGGQDSVDSDHIHHLSQVLQTAAELLGQVRSLVVAALSGLAVARQEAPHSSPWARAELEDALSSATALEAGVTDCGEALALAALQYFGAEQTLGAVLERHTTIPDIDGVRSTAGWLSITGLQALGLVYALSRPKQRNVTVQLELAGLTRVLNWGSGSQPPGVPVPGIAQRLLALTGFDQMQGNLSVALRRPSGLLLPVASIGGSTPGTRHSVRIHEGVPLEVEPPFAQRGPAAVASLSGAMAYSESLAADALLTETGRIGVLRTEAPDGSAAWLMVIPGTREFWGAENPQDYTSNVQMMAGQSDDLTVAAGVILASLPIRTGESVSIMGHSQGGIVATRLAAAGVVPVTHLLTLGSPVGQIPGVPEKTRVTHVESAEDFVPALDGLANSNSENHLTVVFQPGGPIPDSFHPHCMASYDYGIEAARAQSPRVDAQLAALEHDLHWDVEGTQTTEFVFDFRRTQLDESWDALELPAMAEDLIRSRN